MYEHLYYYEKKFISEEQNGEKFELENEILKELKKFNKNVEKHNC